MQRETPENRVITGRPSESATSVLLVDPEPGARDLNCRLLSYRQLSIHAVGSYAEVYQLPEHACYNLIVLDIRPNEVWACQVAEHARRRWPRAKLLLLGESCEYIDDPLYDEMVDPYGNTAGFIEAVERLLAFARSSDILPIDTGH
jgi:CheY-like chemotaxis protein